MELIKRCPKTGKIVGFKNVPKLFLPVVGILSLIWLLVRAIPKPSRLAYPCLRIAAPMASPFLLWLGALLTSAFAFRTAKVKILNKNYRVAALFTILAITAIGFSLLPTNQSTFAEQTEVYSFVDPLGPNSPIGDAKGIAPGRVVWVHDPGVTDESIQNKRKTDVYYNEDAANQKVLDDMFSKALLALTDKNSDSDAWDAVFRYFNKNHDKGDVGYTAGEDIFIKINLVHSSAMNSSGDRNRNYGYVDTSPHAAHAMLKQLVEQAGVPQKNIWIGDPYRPIPNEWYDKWYADYPDINYIYNNANASQQPGRVKVKKSTEKSMYFSDKGAVLDVKDDSYFTCVKDADYILNIPAFKAHRWGGVTLFAKNFFGVNQRDWASHMHKGLHRTDYNEPLRDDYKMYRVFVDLMGNENLGAKTLLYFVDGLWGSWEEHRLPVKFIPPPFNKDYSSSIFMSLDPVAVESVCMDVLQYVFTLDNMADYAEYDVDEVFVHWPAVDDYLHQAASSDWWPDDVKYDPEGDGTYLSSLGVHEHWNNPTDMQYSRNLGTGDGIELVTIFQNSTDVKQDIVTPTQFALYDNYPNPFNPTTTIKYELSQPGYVQLDVFNMMGQRVRTLVSQNYMAGVYAVNWDGRDENGMAVASGAYNYYIKINHQNGSFSESKQMLLLK